MIRCLPDALTTREVRRRLNRYVLARTAFLISAMWSKRFEEKTLGLTQSTPGAPAVEGVPSELSRQTHFRASTERLLGKRLMPVPPKSRDRAPWGQFGSAIPIQAHHAMRYRNRCPRPRAPETGTIGTTVKRGESPSATPRKIPRSHRPSLPPQERWRKTPRLQSAPPPEGGEQIVNRPKSRRGMRPRPPTPRHLS